MQVRTLMYHDVVPTGDFASSGFFGADADSYKLEISRFYEHLTALHRNLRSPVVRATDLFGRGMCASGPTRAALQIGDPPVMLTFDDGGASALRIADVIERHGYHGHFFMPTAFIGRPRFLSAPELRELSARGHVIGSHSASHPLNIAALSLGRLRAEWKNSVDSLCQLLGSEVTTASIPGGHYSDGVAWAAAAAGICILFTSEPTTEICRLGSCQVLGRFAIRCDTPAGLALAYATGQPIACARQWLTWNLKKAAKQLGEDTYLRARAAFFGGGARRSRGNSPHGALWSQRLRERPN